MSSSPRHPLWLRATLWVAAVILMLAAVVYQRETGPTYPHKGSFALGGAEHSYALVRSDWSERTNDAAVVRIPDPGAGATATLHWKRYRTQDPFGADPMTRAMDDDKAVFEGRLPAQPAAGKLEYYVTVDGGGQSQRLPEVENVVIRFKDHVPAWILIPHIIMMFFSVLIGMRTGLAAIFAPGSMRRWAWVALIGMTVGGMVLGPIVQKYAFGEYWTGFPNGGDFTDNKMLFMWLSWVFACAVLGFKPKRNELIPRAAVLLGAAVMTAVYLIPHSMGGSELDYSAVEQGVDPADAIRTGKH